MSCLKGILFVLGVCSSIILLTYLAMVLLPKIRKTSNPNLYRAAVLEVVPFSDSSISIHENILKNLDVYQQAAALAKSNAVDIIVFPESVLYVDVDDHKNSRSALIGSIAENIPNPQEGDYNPCDQESFKDSFLLRNLSCMAKTNSLFLVANMVDYKKCKDGGGETDKNATLNCSDEKECPDDGMYLFNTNVVFNKEGKLATRYHKKHLYFEPTMNPSKCPDKGYFETDFGKFITFICFDILFKEVEETIQETKADSLAYPYYWFDHTPILSFANIYQQAFSVFNGINVLAADSHVPGTGSLGSGIFSASNGAFISTHQPDRLTKLLISNVPKNPKNYTLNINELDRKRFALVNDTFLTASLHDNYTFDAQCETSVVGPSVDLTKDYRCESGNLTDYKFQKLTKAKDTIKVCMNTFCCTFDYKAYSMEDGYFIAVSASDFKLYELFNYSSELCFVTRCKSDDGNGCTSFYLQSKTIFEKAELKGTFINKYIYPFSVDSNIQLTNKDKWNFDGKSEITYENYKDNSSLLFFGLFGRDYGDK